MNTRWAYFPLLLASASGAAVAPDSIFRNLRQEAVTACEQFEREIVQGLREASEFVEALQGLRSPSGRSYDPYLTVCAVIDKESLGDPEVEPRYEEGFCRRYVLSNPEQKHGLSKFRRTYRYTQTEAQKLYCASHGLMQVMYPVAVHHAPEASFDGSIKDLTSVGTNIRIGIAHLRSKLRLALGKGHGNREAFLWMLRYWNGAADNPITLRYALEVENIYESLEDPRRLISPTRRFRPARPARAARESGR